MELKIGRLGKKRSQRLCLDRCGGGPIPESSGPADALCRHNLAIRNSQLILADNGDSCLHGPRSLSRWSGTADGTRPQPMRTDQNHFMASCYVSKGA